MFNMFGGYKAGTKLSHQVAEPVVRKQAKVKVIDAHAYTPKERIPAMIVETENGHQIYRFRKAENEAEREVYRAHAQKALAAKRAKRASDLPLEEAQRRFYRSYSPRRIVTRGPRKGTRYYAGNAKQRASAALAAMTRDMRHAKKYITTKGDYNPRKHDFKGLDDNNGIYKPPTAKQLAAYAEGAERLRKINAKKRLSSSLSGLDGQSGAGYWF